ncbi:hypothetical protein [Streptomyces sp. NPDC127066]|uniref:hypothetical protein n=1 Tax=Streptomyces sp. NPDC127066 TaxID=3347125 RepID=UPI00365BED59
MGRLTGDHGPSEDVAGDVEFAFGEVAAAGGCGEAVDELELLALLRLIDREVLGADHAVGASIGSTAFVKRAGVTLGNDRVLKADGTDGVGVVGGAVVEHAESDVDPCGAQEGVRSAGVSGAGFDGSLDLVEGVFDSVGAGAKADFLASSVALVKVLDLAELDVVEGVSEVLGPFGIGCGVAAGGGVGQGSLGEVLELNAGSDLGTGELVGEHRHRPAEHVRAEVGERDLVESRPPGSAPTPPHLGRNRLAPRAGFRSLNQVARSS